VSSVLHVERRGSARRYTSLPRPFFHKPEFVGLHIDPPSAKAHTLGLEPQSLLDRRISRQLDCAAGSQDSLPRQSIGSPQDPRHQSRSSRKPGSSRDRAIGRNFTARNGANCTLDSQAYDSRILLCLLLGAHSPHKAIHPTRISHSDPRETISHRRIPCTSGRCPTCFTVATEMPLPIRNNVAVSPILAAFTAPA